MSATTPNGVIADYDYSDVDLELAIIEQAGSVVAAQCPTTDQVTKVAHDAGRGASVRNVDLTGRFYHLRTRMLPDLQGCSSDVPGGCRSDSPGRRRAVSLHSRHGEELQRLDAATHRGMWVTG